jgi:CheY-like chemotaxis protein
MAFIKEGLSIVMAENGVRGVEAALKHHPDLILLDIDMPLLNGYETAAEIRKDAWGKNASIIFLTNHNEPSYEAHASLQEPEQYIVKAETPVKEVVQQILKIIQSKS